LFAPPKPQCDDSWAYGAEFSTITILFERKYEIYSKEYNEPNGELRLEIPNQLNGKKPEMTVYRPRQIMEKAPYG